MTSANADPAAEAEVVELVLYVNPGSPSSGRARRNLDVALRNYSPASYRLVLRDVSQHLEESEADHVVFTPTLIVRYPQGCSTLVGDLDDGAVVAMLSMGGMERSG